DKTSELSKIIRFCDKNNVEAVVTNNFEEGGKGARGLAEAVLRSIKRNEKKKPRFLYPLDKTIEDKIDIVARAVYGASGVDFDGAAKADLDLMRKHGFDKLPVCIAKTPLSLSDNPKLLGRPKGFRIRVNELRLNAGAGFVVAICGNIVTMPGLPKVPAAARIRILPNGQAVGLT
ncbi:MAG: formate--tetrahydrofolate ligase, partial [Chitinivibrionales bacterium]